jgi:hypothetical protein
VSDERYERNEESPPTDPPPEDYTANFVGIWRGQVLVTGEGVGTIGGTSGRAFQQVGLNRLAGSGTRFEPPTQWTVIGTTTAKVSSPVDCNETLGTEKWQAHIRITGGTFTIQGSQGRLEMDGLFVIDSDGCPAGPKGTTFHVAISGHELEREQPN